MAKHKTLPWKLQAGSFHPPCACCRPLVGSPLIKENSKKSIENQLWQWLTIHDHGDEKLWQTSHKKKIQTRFLMRHPDMFLQTRLTKPLFGHPWFGVRGIHAFLLQDLLANLHGLGLVSASGLRISPVPTNSRDICVISWIYRIPISLND